MLKPQVTFQELRREAEQIEAIQTSTHAEESPSEAALQVPQMTDVLKEIAAELGKLRDLPAQLETANRRIASLQASRATDLQNWTHPGCICHRCGDSGHIARACRVAVMYTNVDPACEETVPTHQPEKTTPLSQLRRPEQRSARMDRPPSADVTARGPGDGTAERRP